MIIASPLFVVMGVSASGKSTLAEALARLCGGEYLDADTYHPPENVAKMKAGTPLNDDDRASWLVRLNAALRARSSAGKPVFLACSALKQDYRGKLADGGLSLKFIYLKASKAEIRQRLDQRRGHFMSPALLDSQFATLEEPADALTLDAEEPLTQLVSDVKGSIRTLPWH